MFNYPGGKKTELKITKTYAEDKLSKVKVTNLKAVS
jgi:hypothetical protein